MSKTFWIFMCMLTVFVWSWGFSEVGKLMSTRSDLAVMASMFLTFVLVACGIIAVKLAIILFPWRKK